MRSLALLGLILAIAPSADGQAQYDWYWMHSGDPSGSCVGGVDGIWVNYTTGQRWICEAGTWQPKVVAVDAATITTGTVDPARLGSGSGITTKFLRGDSTWQTVSGGAAAWGDITGVLSAQTDLQGALDAKEVAGTFSGVGICTNQFARALNDGAAPTCASVATGDVANDAVTYAKIQNVTDARLLGRSAGSAGDAMEITVGSGLSLSAGNLTATGGGGGPTITRKAADQSSTSTTFADVAGMTRAVSASTSYSFVCHLSYLSAATTTALQVSINGPASPTAVRFTVETSTSATARHNASQSAYDAVTNPASALTTALPVMVSGSVENGANAGTLALRMRTEVSGSSVTIQRGSYCAWY